MKPARPSQGPTDQGSATAAGGGAGGVEPEAAAASRPEEAAAPEANAATAAGAIDATAAPLAGTPAEPPPPPAPPAALPALRQTAGPPPASPAPAPAVPAALPRKRDDSEGGASFPVAPRRPKRQRRGSREGGLSLAAAEMAAGTRPAAQPAAQPAPPAGGAPAVYGGECNRRILAAGGAGVFSQRLREAVLRYEAAAAAAAPAAAPVAAARVAAGGSAAGGNAAAGLATLGAGAAGAFGTAAGASGAAAGSASGAAGSSSGASGAASDFEWVIEDFADRFLTPASRAAATATGSPLRIWSPVFKRGSCLARLLVFPHGNEGAGAAAKHMSVFLAVQPTPPPSAAGFAAAVACGCAAGPVKAAAARRADLRRQEAALIRMLQEARGAEDGTAADFVAPGCFEVDAAGGGGGGGGGGAGEGGAAASGGSGSAPIDVVLGPSPFVDFSAANDRCLICWRGAVGDGGAGEAAPGGPTAGVPAAAAGASAGGLYAALDVARASSPSNAAAAGGNAAAAAAAAAGAAAVDGSPRYRPPFPSQASPWTDSDCGAGPGARRSTHPLAYDSSDSDSDGEKAGGGGGGGRLLWAMGRASYSLAAVPFDGGEAVVKSDEYSFNSSENDRGWPQFLPIAKVGPAGGRAGGAAGGGAGGASGAGGAVAAAGAAAGGGAGARSGLSGLAGAFASRPAKVAPTLAGPSGQLLLRARLAPRAVEFARPLAEAVPGLRVLGMRNTGATCYLNCMVQALFHLGAFRRAIFLLSKAEDAASVALPPPPGLMDPATGAWVKEVPAIDQAELTEKEVREAFGEHGGAAGGAAGGAGGGGSGEFLPPCSVPAAAVPAGGGGDAIFSSTATSAVGACGVSGTPGAAAALSGAGAAAAGAGASGNAHNAMCRALQKLFLSLSEGSSAASTSELLASFGWGPSESLMQHDAQEFNRLLCDRLEELCKGTPAQGLIRKLFLGVFENYIRCMDVQYESVRREEYYDLQVDVDGVSDIYASLRKYCEEETLEGENAYSAEGHGKQRARKGVRFVTFPPVLQFHLKRFRFDPYRMEMVKQNSRFEYPFELDLSRVVPGAGEYELASVVVHSGDVGGGHYVGLTRPLGGRLWVKLDDDKVTPVTEDAALEDCYGCDPAAGSAAAAGGRSNAYILFYVRKAVARAIIQAPPPERVNPFLKERLRREQLRNERRERIRSLVEQSILVRFTTERSLLGTPGFFTDVNALKPAFERRYVGSTPMAKVFQDILSDVLPAVGAGAGRDAGGGDAGGGAAGGGDAGGRDAGGGDACGVAATVSGVAASGVAAPTPGFAGGGGGFAACGFAACGVWFFDLLTSSQSAPAVEVSTLHPTPCEFGELDYPAAGTGAVRGAAGGRSAITLNQHYSWVHKRLQCRWSPSLTLLLHALPPGGPPAPRDAAALESWGQACSDAKQVMLKLYLPCACDHHAPGAPAALAATAALADLPAKGAANAANAANAGNAASAAGAASAVAAAGQSVSPATRLAPVPASGNGQGGRGAPSCPLCGLPNDPRRLFFLGLAYLGQAEGPLADAVAAEFVRKMRAPPGELPPGVTHQVAAALEAVAAAAPATAAPAAPAAPGAHRKAASAGAAAAAAAFAASIYLERDMHFTRVSGNEEEVFSLMLMSPADAKEPEWPSACFVLALPPPEECQAVSTAPPAPVGVGGTVDRKFALPPAAELATAVAPSRAPLAVAAPPPPPALLPPLTPSQFAHAAYNDSVACVDGSLAFGVPPPPPALLPGAPTLTCYTPDLWLQAVTRANIEVTVKVYDLWEQLGAWESAVGAPVATAPAAAAGAAAGAAAQPPAPPPAQAALPAGAGGFPSQSAFAAVLPRPNSQLSLSQSAAPATHPPPSPSSPTPPSIEPRPRATFAATVDLRVPLLTVLMHVAAAAGCDGRFAAFSPSPLPFCETYFAVPAELARAGEGTADAAAAAAASAVPLERMHAALARRQGRAQSALRPAAQWARPAPFASGVAYCVTSLASRAPGVIPVRVMNRRAESVGCVLVPVAEILAAESLEAVVEGSVRPRLSPEALRRAGAAFPPLPALPPGAAPPLRLSWVGSPRCGPQGAVARLQSNFQNAVRCAVLPNALEFLPDAETLRERVLFLFGCRMDAAPAAVAKIEVVFAETPLRVEVGEDEAEAEDRRRLRVTVIHQSKDRAFFGHPFFIYVDPSERFRQIREQIRLKVNVSESAFTQWKVFLYHYEQSTFVRDDEVPQWSNVGPGQPQTLLVVHRDVALSADAESGASSTQLALR